MDINLPLDLQALSYTPQNPAAALDLKIGQIIDAKVIETQIVLNNFSLSIAGKTIAMQAQAPLDLQTGQTLQLQVIKVFPALEVILLPASPQQLTPQVNKTPEQALLRQLLPASLSPTSTSPTLPNLQKGQSVPALIVSISGDKLGLRLLNPPDTSSGSSGQAIFTTNPKSANMPQALLTLDSKQWVFAMSEPASEANSAHTSGMPTGGLRVGEQVQLKLLQTGKQVQFEVTLNPHNPSIDTQQKLKDLFKQLLPLQNSPTVVFNQLRQLLTTSENPPAVSATLKLLAQQLFASLPKQVQLSNPLQLKQSIDQSGLFLESKLLAMLVAKNDINLSTDLKFKLLKFSQILSNELIALANTETTSKTTSALLKELLQHTDGSLAKLTLDQFNSLKTDETAKQAWIFELPYSHHQGVESLQIEIQLDKRQENTQMQKNWAVSITITPPELATIHCKISCYDGTINTRFWSEAEATVQKISTHLDYLKQQLEQKGLTTGFMEAHQGKPLKPLLLNQPPVNLLNEKV